MFKPWYSDFWNEDTHRYDKTGYPYHFGKRTFQDRKLRLGLFYFIFLTETHIYCLILNCIHPVQFIIVGTFRAGLFPNIYVMIINRNQPTWIAQCKKHFILKALYPILDISLAIAPWDQSRHLKCGTKTFRERTETRKRKKILYTWDGQRRWKIPNWNTLFSRHLFLPSRIPDAQSSAGSFNCVENNSLSSLFLTAETSPWWAVFNSSGICTERHHDSLLTATIRGRSAVQT